MPLVSDTSEPEPSNSDIPDVLYQTSQNDHYASQKIREDNVQFLLQRIEEMTQVTQSQAKLIQKLEKQRTLLVAHLADVTAKVTTLLAKDLYSHCHR